MTQVLIVMTVETQDVAGLKKWVTAKSVDTPLVRPLVEVAPKVEPRPNIAVEAAAHRLFDYWRQASGHTRAKATSDRLAKLKARLRDGYDEDYVRSAIDRFIADPYVVDGKKYDDLVTLCKSGAALERYGDGDRKPVSDRKPQNLAQLRGVCPFNQCDGSRFINDDEMRVAVRCQCHPQYGQIKGGAA